MKKNTFRAILALACLGMLSLQAQAQGIVVNKTDGTKVYYKATDVESVGVYGYAKNPNPRHPKPPPTPLMACRLSWFPWRVARSRWAAQPAMLGRMKAPCIM